MKFLLPVLFLAFSAQAARREAPANAPRKAKPPAEDKYEKAVPSKKAGQVVPAQMLEKLQKTWDDAGSYQATFKQVVFAKRLGTRDESTGMLYVLKPNRLRWESNSDGGVQIMNDNKLWVVQKNRRRETVVVDIYNDLKKAIDAKPLSFLSGKSKFKDLYRVELLSETPAVAELKFTPHSDTSETLVAEIDKESYLLRSLTSEAVDSRTRTEFSNIRTNVKLEEKLFTYTPAKDDVVHNN